MGGMAGGPQRVNVQVADRQVVQRLKVAAGAGLLLVALGASACSSAPPSLGRSLPISVEPNGSGLQASQCILDSSGTRVFANGTFSRRYSLPTDMYGQPQTRILQLEVLTSQTHTPVGVHDIGVGNTSSGISVGQKSWHLEATVEHLSGLRPTHCVVGLAPQI